MMPYLHQVQTLGDIARKVHKHAYLLRKSSPNFQIVGHDMVIACLADCVTVEVVVGIGGR